MTRMVGFHRRKTQTTIHNGNNGAGAVTIPFAQLGAKIRSVYDITASADVTGSFEATVSVAGQIQQTAATNLSAHSLRFHFNLNHNIGS